LGVVVSGGVQGSSVEELAHPVCGARLLLAVAAMDCSADAAVVLRPLTFALSVVLAAAAQALEVAAA